MDFKISTQPLQMYENRLLDVWRVFICDHKGKCDDNLSNLC